MLVEQRVLIVLVQIQLYFIPKHTHIKPLSKPQEELIDSTQNLSISTTIISSHVQESTSLLAKHSKRRRRLTKLAGFARGNEALYIAKRIAFMFKNIDKILKKSVLSKQKKMSTKYILKILFKTNVIQGGLSHG